MSEHTTDLFPTADDVEPDHLQRLHSKLETLATDDVDVAYRTIDGPLGEMLLAATPAGLVRVAFANEGLDDVLQTLAERVSPRILRSPARLDPAAKQLDEYFERRRSDFDLPLDRTLSSGFRRRVQDWLPHIAYGTTASYADVARALDAPNATRAVGSGCAKNPLPVVVPCHRVLRSDGSLGGYAGGLANKRVLLDLERGNRDNLQTEGQQSLDFGRN